MTNNQRSNDGVVAVGPPTGAALTRRTLIRTGAAAATVLGAGGVLAACGSKSSGVSTSGAATGPTGTSGGAAPQKGGILRVAALGGGASETLNPNNTASNVDFCRAYQVYEGLTILDGTGKVVNVLAQEFIPNKDATKWTIRLKPGVKWHDGKPFTADDVIYSMRYSTVGATFAVSSYNGVDLKSLKKIDAHTLTVSCPAPLSILPELFTDNFAKIIQDGTKKFTSPIGTGPFTFESWTVGQTASYKRFDGYHGTPALLDGVQVISINDASARLNALESHQADVATGVPLALVKTVQNNPAYVLTENPGGQFSSLNMTIENGQPLHDVKVRQALRLLVDRDAIVKNAYSGHAKVGNDMGAWYDPAYAKDLPQRTIDPEQAKALLKQAGQENLKLELHTSDIVDGIVETSTLFSEMAAKGGVTVSIKTDPAATFWSKTYAKVPFFSVYYLGRPLAYLMHRLYNPTDPFNTTKWNNAQFNSHMADVLKTVDPAKRTQSLHDAQALLYNEGGDLVPAFGNYLTASTKAVQGLLPGIAQPLNNYDFSKVSLSA